MRAKMMVVAIAILTVMPRLQGADVPAKTVETPDSLRQKIAATRVLADTVTGGWRFGRQHMDNYGSEFLTAERLAEMKKEYLARLGELHRFQPEDAATCNEYAACLAYNGKADDALKILAPFAANTNLPADLQADILMNLAEASAVKQDFTGATRYARELLSREIPVRSRDTWNENLRRAAELAVFIEDGWDLDALKLPVYTGAKVFPTAQEAAYTENFVPLKSVRIATGKDMKANDARLRLLKVKLERFGIGFDLKAAFVISINEGKLAPPEKTEGYALSITPNGATLQGRDTLGTTWAVVSLIQLIDQERKAVRICEIKDWPDVADRGYGLVSDYRYTLESALFGKIGMVSDQKNELTLFLSAVPPFRQYLLSKMFRAHREFGIAYYWGDRGLIPGLPLTSDNVVRILKEYWMSVADAGATGIIGCHEDFGGLVPMHEADRKNAGGADRLHGRFFTRLFREVRQAHPDFQCLLWLPLDFGPDKPAAVRVAETSMACTREAYLQSLKRDLDPDIVMMFMGNRRGAYTREKLENDWVKSLHGHRLHLSTVRPLSPYGYASLADEIPFGKNYYSGIGDDIAGISIYLAAPRSAVPYAKFSDSLWNMAAYDRRESAKRACEIYLGKGLYEAMKPAADAFAELNAYYNPHDSALTPLALRKIDRFSACVNIAQAALKKAQELNPQTVMAYDDGYMGAATYVLKQAQQAKPDHFHATYAAKIEACKALARKEVGLNEAAGDLFRSPADFLGGTLANTKENAKEPLITYFRGADTPLPAVEFAFETDKPGPLELVLRGMQERDRLRPVTWRVQVNGKTVYEGGAGLADWPGKDGGNDYAVVKIGIPADALAKRNVIRLECTNVGGTVHFSPWIGLNYAVIRKAQ